MDLDQIIKEIRLAGPAWKERSLDAESRGSIDSANAEEIRSIGAHRLTQPFNFGGAQSSIEDHMRAVAVAGEYCMSTAWCLAVWSAHNWMASHFPAGGQHDFWQDPRNLISASIVPKTKFKAVGQDVLVSGRFSFGSGCDHASWLGVGGLVGDKTPSPVICMLPKDSISIDHESWEVSGLRGTGSKELVIAGEVLVPAHRVLRVSESMNRESPGQKLYDHPLYMTPWRTTAILVLAAPLIGAAKAAIGRFRERMDNHVLLALKTTQLNDPLALNRLAESSAEIQAAELMLYHAAKQLDLLGAADEVDPLDNAVIIRDCGFAVRLLANSVDRLFEASGGSALSSAEPMQRIWRDVHAARSHAVLTWDHASHTYSQALFK